MIAVVAWLAIAASSNADEPGRPAFATIGHLAERAQEYYEALMLRDPKAVWLFFAPSLREDNPFPKHRTDFAKGLGSKGRIEVVKSPSVDFDREVGISGFKFGVATAVIRMYKVDGSYLTDGIHHTRWRWMELAPGSGYDWYLVGDSVYEFQTAR